MVNANTNYDQADNNARQIIIRTQRVTRRQLSPEEKVRIVIEGIRGEITVTTLCRGEGIATNVYYKWLKDFIEAGKGCLKGDSRRETSRAEVQSLQRENQRLKELVAQLSVENLVPKESLG